MDIPKYGLLIHSPPFQRSNVTHQAPHNDIINAIFSFNSYHVSYHRGRPLTCQPLHPHSSAAFVVRSFNMCHFHCCAVSRACLECQFEALLARRNYGITSHVGEKPDDFLFIHMSFKAGL